jgi:very-short-patch-repair endonuclease
MRSYQFYRQFPIGNFIVDFICRKLKLIIEVDGSTHNVRGSEDFHKQKFLENLGFVVIRFTEGEIIYRIDDVVVEIYEVIEKLEKEIPLDHNE